MENVDFDGAKRIMASRVLVATPGKYHLKVTNDVLHLATTGKVHKELAGGKHQISIVNFAGCTPYHLSKFRSHMKEGAIDESLKKTMLTASVRDGDYIPQKNEMVEVNVNYIETKEGEQALAVVGYNPMPVSSGRKLNRDTILDEVAVEQRAAVEFAKV
jgi:hypothetical protein